MIWVGIYLFTLFLGCSLLVKEGWQSVVDFIVAHKIIACLVQLWNDLGLNVINLDVSECINNLRNQILFVSVVVLYGMMKDNFMFKSFY
jgi:hypothetical protein